MDERLIRSYRAGFPHGESPVVREDDALDSVGFDFSIHRYRGGERREERSAKESVWILMDGEARVRCGDRACSVRRTSLFEEPPTVLSAGPGTSVGIESVGETEWAVARVSHPGSFAARVFLPDEVGSELRGKGLALDASVRNVRLVFDSGVRPESRLVVGEVVNYPGRWSSYPPHNHPQPELYHYRFTAPQGYGHAELDEHVFKVRPNDTVKILGGECHAQVSAPGYGMYYLWIVRHLEGRPYRGFEHAPEHRWLLDPRNPCWSPRE